MTHEAPPSSDPRPQKVSKTAEDATPSAPAADPMNVGVTAPAHDEKSKSEPPPPSPINQHKPMKNDNPQAVDPIAVPIDVDTKPIAQEHTANGNAHNDSVSLPDPTATGSKQSKPPVEELESTSKEAGESGNGKAMPTSEASLQGANNLKTVSEEPKLVVEEPKPIAEQPELAVQEPNPVSEEPATVAGVPQPGVGEAKQATKETETVGEDPKPVDKDPKPIPDELKPELLPEEGKLVAEPNQKAPEELKAVATEPKSTSDELEAVTIQPKPVAEAAKELEHQPKSLAEEVKQLAKETSQPSAAITLENVQSKSEPTSENPNPSVDPKPAEELHPPNLSSGAKKDQSQASPNNLSQVTLTLSEYMATRPRPIIVDSSTLTDSNASPLSAEKLEQFHAAVTARNAVCVLLAAGQGSRFISDVPKVIHPLCGKPLAQHMLDTAAAAKLPVVVVVGHARKAVVDTLSIRDGAHVVYVCQDEQLGTGHAVYVASTAFPSDFSGDVIVSYADNPGVDSELLRSFLDAHAGFKARYEDKYGAMAVTGSRKHAGRGTAAYGRIVRQNKDSGPVLDIIEKKAISKLAEDDGSMKYADIEWSAQELDDIDEFNSGIVVGCGKPYLDVLSKVKGSMTKKEPVTYEYYATDFVKGLVAKGMVAEGFQVSHADIWKLEGTNTVEELNELKVKMEAALAKPSANGVTLPSDVKK